jgi:hypothetical protein
MLWEGRGEKKKRDGGRGANEGSFSQLASSNWSRTAIFAANANVIKMEIVATSIDNLAFLRC